MKPALWLLLAARLAAQPACALQGTVTDSVTRQPLAGVKIFVHTTAEGSAPAYLRRSDARGHFCFERLGQGSYHLIAQRAGYLDQFYGAKPGAGDGIALTVGTLSLPETKIEMIPRPILSGTVLHADGQPAAQAEVMAWRKVRTREGSDQESVQSAETDDRGIFRFADLPPGIYYLSAQPDADNSERVAIEFLNDQGQHQHEQETATFYPAAGSVAGARPVVLRAGQETGGLTIALRNTELRHVSGRVTGVSSGSTIYLDPQSEGLRGETISIGPDGSFERSDLLPGKYLVQLRGQAGDRMAAEQEVDLSNGNVEGLTLETQETFAVPLVFKTEPGAVPVRPGQFWTMLASIPRGSARLAQTAAGGGMEFTRLLPGIYRLDVGTGGEGYYLKSVTMNGATQSPDRLDLRAPPNGPLELNFSAHVARVEGNVSEKPAGAVTVLLARPDPEEDEIGWERKAATDQNGAFALDGIKPGKYRLYAIEGFDESAWGSLELAAALKSVEVELKESETRQITVPLVREKEWDAAVERAGQ